MVPTLFFLVSYALLKLLHECIGILDAYLGMNCGTSAKKIGIAGTSVLSGKYCELVMKCIWKVSIFNVEPLRKTLFIYFINYNIYLAANTLKGRVWGDECVNYSNRKHNNNV